MSEPINSGQQALRALNALNETENTVTALEAIPTLLSVIADELSLIRRALGNSDAEPKTLFYLYQYHDATLGTVVIDEKTDAVFTKVTRTYWRDAASGDLIAFRMMADTHRKILHEGQP